MYMPQFTHSEPCWLKSGGLRQLQIAFASVDWYCDIMLSLTSSPITMAVPPTKTVRRTSMPTEDLEGRVSERLPADKVPAHHVLGVRMPDYDDSRATFICGGGLSAKLILCSKAPRSKRRRTEALREGS